MKLITLNVDSDYFKGCVEHQTDGKGAEVLFIDWLPTTQEVTQSVTYQIQLIESTPWDVQMVIFDRYSAMTDEEIDFFNDRGAILLEPVLKPRFGFLFMPYYLDKLDLPLSTWDKERPFHCGYKGKELSAYAEGIMLKSIKEVSNVKIGVSVKTHLPIDRYNSLKEIITFGNFGWSRFNTTIVTGSDEDYYRGVLPDITQHLKYGVVPLVHHRHKWFHALFRNFLVFDHQDISWYKRMYRTINYGMLDEIYENIEIYLPEMLTENFVTTIISLGDNG